MAGRYEPYDEKDMIKLVAEAKSKIPKWVRIMRVQREISAAEIVAGPKYGNFQADCTAAYEQERYAMCMY